MSRLAEPADPQLSDSAATAPQGDSVARIGTWHKVLPYLSIARPDHWIKNSFMGLGVLLAFF